VFWAIKLIHFCSNWPQKLHLGLSTIHIITKQEKKENNKRKMTYPSYAVALVRGGQSGGG
jgi:hypothetical protein